MRTKVRAERVKKAMERVNIETDTIHSDRLQEEREQIMHNFRGGTLKVLIATDVSARGIDIPNVEYVVNYDLPDTSEYYVHRVGRTGRGTQRGQAVSLCSNEEKEQLELIEENLGKPITRIEITKGEYRDVKEATGEKVDDWKSLVKQIAQEEERSTKSVNEKSARSKWQMSNRITRCMGLN